LDLSRKIVVRQLLASKIVNMEAEEAMAWEAVARQLAKRQKIVCCSKL
jgi:hypothetical protein